MFKFFQLLSFCLSNSIFYWLLLEVRYFSSFQAKLFFLDFYKIIRFGSVWIKSYYLALYTLIVLLCKGEHVIRSDCFWFCLVWAKYDFDKSFYNGMRHFLRYLISLGTTKNTYPYSYKEFNSYRLEAYRKLCKVVYGFVVVIPSNTWLKQSRPPVWCPNCLGAECI